MSLKRRVPFSWKRIFGKKVKESISYEIEDGGERVLPTFHRENINIHRTEEREQYIRNCLEQIADAEREIHHLEYEYNMVTSHLTDIEELSRAPEEMQFDIREAAQKLEELQKMQSGEPGRVISLSWPLKEPAGTVTREKPFSLTNQSIVSSPHCRKVTSQVVAISAMVEELEEVWSM